MALNEKLTGVIRGRQIRGTQNQGCVLTILFNDGSRMSVQTASSSNSASTGGTVGNVRQQDTRLTLVMEGGSTWEIETAEPTSSVMVRDANGQMEYSD